MDPQAGAGPVDGFEALDSLRTGNLSPGEPLAAGCLESLGLESPDELSAAGVEADFDLRESVA